AASPLEPYEVLTDKRRGFQRALCDVEVEPAARFAVARSALVLRVERTLLPRIDAQGLLPLLTEIELPLARVLSRMEQVGVSVDRERLSQLEVRYRARIDALEEKAYALAGHEFKIGSPRALETVLFDELGLPVVKRTKTSRSTD